MPNNEERSGRLPLPARTLYIECEGFRSCGIGKDGDCGTELAEEEAWPGSLERRREAEGLSSLVEVFPMVSNADGRDVGYVKQPPSIRNSYPSSNYRFCLLLYPISGFSPAYEGSTLGSSLSPETMPSPHVLRTA